MRSTATRQTADFAPMNGFVLRRKCDCGNHAAGGECQGCAKKKQALQRVAAGEPEAAAVPSIVHDVLRSPGQPLDTSTRNFFEPRFGHDFCNVRVHADSRASESAHAVNALAYTVGSDIVFQNGLYSPESASGRRLIAHELTHTIQQSAMQGSTLGPFRIGPVDDVHEREADAHAAEVVDMGTPLRGPIATSVPTLQRQPPPDDKPKEKPAEAPKAPTSCMKEAKKSIFSRGND